MRIRCQDDAICAESVDDEGVVADQTVDVYQRKHIALRTAIEVPVDPTVQSSKTMRTAPYNPSGTAGAGMWNGKECCEFSKSTTSNVLPSASTLSFPDT